MSADISPWAVVALAIDATLLASAMIAAYALRFNFAIPTNHVHRLALILPASVLIELASLWICGCRRVVWRYFSIADVPRFTIAAAMSLAAFLLMRIPGRPSIPYPPISVAFINAVLSLALLVAVRVLRRAVTEKPAGAALHSNRVVIVGAGEAGNSLLWALRHDRSSDREVVGFLEDSPGRAGARIQGVYVLGPVADAERIFARVRPDEVIVTTPHLARDLVQRLFELSAKAGARLLFAPDYTRILDGIAHPGRMREAEISDILRRPETTLSGEAEKMALLSGRRVMVTGAGGSIGSEIARQVLATGPASLILVERCENALFNVCRAIGADSQGGKVVPCVASITDETRMRHILSAHRPEIVIHAAAHKHVPMMEENVCEAISNNVLGTALLCRLSEEAGVERFVLLSTDKAVRPSSVMGATKRMCEFTIASRSSATVFCAVRFGNVLGASGSVVPIFREQIAAGGPVTVTHPDMTRYFMTIQEAVHLTLEAASYAKGGEVFILDMGEPVRIVNLAEDMIRLSGHVPGADIAIAFSGVRKGEKMSEELSLASENVSPTRHPQISCGRLASLDAGKLAGHLEALASTAAAGDDDAARSLLMRIVKEDA